MRKLQAVFQFHEMRYRQDLTHGANKKHVVVTMIVLILYDPYARFSCPGALQIPNSERPMDLAESRSRGTQGGTGARTL